jgi:serine/threonine-protein kinase
MLVTPDLRLKVADFGIARALASIRPDEQSDVVWGSPQYFAPEQASGAAPSPASDVYSLGVILYEMLAGELPFQATNADDLARLHMEARPPDIRTKVPAISPDLEQVLLKVLSKEPAQRYRTADQLGRILNNLIPMDKAPALALTTEAARVPPGNVRTLRPTQGSALRPTQESSFRPAQDSTLEKTPPRAVPHLPEPALSIDFLSVGLGLLALVTVLGLIPFWVWVYFVYNPPIR